jgi:hypothetical protein
MKKLKEQEIQPETFEERIKPEIYTETEILELFQSKGIISSKPGGYGLTQKGYKILREVEEARDVIVAYGHPNITATHKTTLEITKEKYVKKEGTCIIGVKANKACKDLNEKLKNVLKDGKKLYVTIEAEGEKDSLEAIGSPALELTNEKNVVIRKSDFIDDRTLAILSNKAACDLKRSLVKKLKNPETKIIITLEVKPT